jgi:rod shape-determining protein MreC
MFSLILCIGKWKDKSIGTDMIRLDTNFCCVSQASLARMSRAEGGRLLSAVPPASPTSEIRGIPVINRSRTRLVSTSSSLTSRKSSRRSVAPWSGIVCFVVLAVVCLTLLTWKVKSRMPVALFESAVLSMTQPVQRAVTWTTQGVKGIWGSYISLVHVQQENARLREEIRWLRQENHRYLETYLQYQRLQRLLNLREQVPHDVVVSEVVGRNSNNWTEIIYINKGTRDRIVKGLPVVTHEGLVGQVIHAAPGLSQVMLLTDFRSGVDALVQRTRISGIVSGRGRNVAELRFLPVGADLQPGDRLISSGMGGVFPKGLIIGEVNEVHANGRQSHHVEIQPGVDFSHLEEVMVLVRP